MRCWLKDKWRVEGGGAGGEGKREEDIEPRRKKSVLLCSKEGIEVEIEDIRQTICLLILRAGDEVAPYPPPTRTSFALSLSLSMSHCVPYDDDNVCARVFQCGFLFLFAERKRGKDKKNMMKMKSIEWLLRRLGFYFFYLLFILKRFIYLHTRWRIIWIGYWRVRWSEQEFGFS